MRIRQLTLNLVNAFVGLAEAFLGLRLILKLFGANAETGFVSWLYEVSGVLLEPFRGIFPTKVFENQYVLEFSTIFAMLVYALLGYLLFVLVEAVTPGAKKRRK